MCSDQQHLDGEKDKPTVSDAKWRSYLRERADLPSRGHRVVPSGTFLKSTVAEIQPLS